MIISIYEKLKGKFVRDPRSLITALCSIAPLNILEAEISKLNDWRVITENLAIKLGISEAALLHQVSETLHLPILERVPPCSLKGLPQNITLNDFEQAGAIPFMKSGRIVGVVCIDPKRLLSLGLNLRKLEIYLAPWVLIHKAIKESRIIYDQIANKDSSTGISATNSKIDISQQIIKKLVREVIGYGHKEVRLVFGSESIEYDFTLQDGKVGKGEINVKLTPLLLRYLRELHHHPKAISFEDSDLQSIIPVVKFLPGALTTISIGWSGELRSSELKKEELSKEEGSQQNQNSKTLETRCILLVEDNETFAMVVERFLTAKGFQLHWCESAKDALDFIKKDATALSAIICDIHMPEMDGITFLKKLRSNEEAKLIPTIALTSDIDLDTELMALSLGVDAFITKDEDPRILLLHVERLTGRLGNKILSQEVG